MSDQIPIGSPPVPAGRHGAPAGWFPDPTSPYRSRYWDGWQWTTHVRDADPATTAGGNQSGTIRSSHEVNGDFSQRAGFGIRTAAWLIDALLVMLVGVLVSTIMIMVFDPSLTEVMVQAGNNPASPPALSWRQQWIILGPILLIAILYFSLMWRFKSATLGQLMCRLKVISTDGKSRLGFREITPRLISRVLWLTGLGLFGFAFALLDGLRIIRSKDRRALHDVIGHTAVISVAKNLPR